MGPPWCEGLGLELKFSEEAGGPGGPEDADKPPSLLEVLEPGAAGFLVAQFVLIDLKKNIISERSEWSDYNSKNGHYRPF